MIKIGNETNSMVWARGLKNKGIEIIVQNPWGSDISEKVSEILKEGGLSLREDPHVTKQGVDVNIPLLNSSQMIPKIDDLDKNIARTLLINGYYETPRPDGITQERLAKELQISKPVLEKRMRKIQAIGIRNLLGHQGFTKEEIKAGWETLQGINTGQVGRHYKGLTQEPNTTEINTGQVGRHYKGLTQEPNTTVG
jgi:hypothetical protein